MYKVANPGFKLFLSIDLTQFYKKKYLRFKNILIIFVNMVNSVVLSLEKYR